MSDEEDFDELPSIEVNSALPDASLFLMPSAEAVAAARAREAHTEGELRRLREEHPVCGLAAAASDSSGSEGEAALAAAVAALRVLPTPPGPPHAPPPHLLHALRAALPAPPPPFLHLYMEAARERSEADLNTLTAELLRDVSEMAYETASAADVQHWADDEFLGVAAWVCALAAAGGGAGGVVRRLLHVLVEEVGSAVQVEALRGVVVRAAAGGALEALAALQLCGALQSGGERGPRLAAGLAVRALAALADLPVDQEVSLEACGRALGGAGGWRRLAPPRRYLALQLLARGGGAGGEEGARRALVALHAAPQPPGRAHSADMLKVLVAASKLSVLFHVQE